MWWIALVVLIAVVLLSNAFLFSLIKINKTSMLPTFSDGNTVFLNKVAYKKHAPASGDIIVFRRTTASGTDYVVKRIIGVPGDKIDIQNGNVYRNNILLDEPYVEYHSSDELSVTVPKHRYFVLGDNRQKSLDSRNEEIGFVRRREIYGKVIFKIFPFEGIDIVSHEYADKK